MIRIFNKKLNSEILIDESIDWIQFNPKHYYDKPHVIIEFKNFNFFLHARECRDCKKFINAFGKDSFDWYISYFDNFYRLDTIELGNGTYPHNEIKLINSDYELGTKMILVFHQIPTDKIELGKLKEKAVELENYEKACVYRDLINESLKK